MPPAARPCPEWLALFFGLVQGFQASIAVLIAFGTVYGRRDGVVLAVALLASYAAFAVTYWALWARQSQVDSAPTTAHADRRRP